ncbi:hypothetical protein [Leifsonia sp. AG29]|uniref:hypothetical protein n=1 Tax=Leifsonia sp. AG29 TaxID=2598860 RepID=UPI00131C351E|nr:hypothetical protein [Leifsonia sp. AG29]
MVNYRSLFELEDAQDRESARERERIDLGDEYIGYYRSRMHRMMESFHEFCAREGIADDPDFRHELDRVSEMTDNNARQTDRMLIDLDEEFWRMKIRHSDEREEYIASRRTE